MIDAIPRPWHQVAAAICITALSDRRIGHALTPFVSGCRDLWLTAAWRGVHDPTIGATAGAVLDEVLPALEPAGYDDPIVAAATEFADRYTRRGRSLAEDRLDAWKASGSVAPTPEPQPSSASVGGPASGSIATTR